MTDTLRANHTYLRVFIGCLLVSPEAENHIANSFLYTEGFEE